MELIPIDSIDIQKRLRYAQTPEEKEKIEHLKESITRFGGFPRGLLQPIVLDQNKVLLFGWRRFTACMALGWKEMPFITRERVSDSEYFEIEFAENNEREGFTWQQMVKGVCQIHRQRTREALIKGEEWDHSMTGEVVGGYSRQYVFNCLSIEPLLSIPEVNELPGITEALRFHLRLVEDKAKLEQAKRTGLMIAPTMETVDLAVASLLADSEPDSGPTIVADPSTYNQEEEQEVNLSSCLFFGDSARVILPKFPSNSIDHIITDMPYAIDMKHLQQASNALIDASRVEDTHEVEENFDLFNLMFPECFRVLKDGGYFITWCDIMCWQRLYDLAISCGFKVQRWPITWVKTSTCKCQQAHVLFTKNTEIAIVCRKGKASLPKPVGSCVISCPNSDKESNPFAKPFQLWEFLINSVSIQGQTILDPCAGEGSCTLATLKLNRKPIAIEKDEKHFPFLVENVKDFWKGVFKKVKFS